MKPLETRKEELLVACRIQREVVALELDVLRLHAERLRLRGRRLGEIWKWAAPLGGLLMAGRLGHARRKPGLRSLKWVLALQVLQWWWKRRGEREAPGAKGPSAS